MCDYSLALGRLLSDIEGCDPDGAINEVVDLAMDMGDEHAAMVLQQHPEFLEYRSILTHLYHKYIMAMEADEVEKLTLRSANNYRRSFREVAGEAAMMAYNRVGDMFEYVDFSTCRHFVLVGCGQLPMTALHVNDRTGVEAITCLDISPEAITAVQGLTAVLDGLRLRSFMHDGETYDYGSADIVYIANMVSPKSAVVSRVLETAPEDVQIVIREPYSLGHLWAENAEESLDPLLKIKSRGRGSRYLSRDIFLQRQNQYADRMSR